MESLCASFRDYEKAFESVDGVCVWKLLRRHGIPEKITSIIQNSYKLLTLSVMHTGQLTHTFPVRTGVTLLSPFLFLLAIDWIMKQSTSQKEMEYDGNPSPRQHENYLRQHKKPLWNIQQIGETHKRQKCGLDCRRRRTKRDGCNISRSF